MSSKIENVIGEIEDYLADCKAMPFSSTKICVEKDRIDSLVSELRLKILMRLRNIRRRDRSLIIQGMLFLMMLRPGREYGKSGSDTYGRTYQ